MLQNRINAAGEEAERRLCRADEESGRTGVWMRLVFMGTPDFAVPALKALYEAGHEILLAVSQPDKPKGRHGELAEPPVKAYAVSKNIPVLQPDRASDPDFVERVRSLAPDAIVVAAYGKLLKEPLLSIPKYGCINIHASLLPRWRGAAPIQWAVMEGDAVSGVTAMQMDAGLDTGDMLLKRSIPLKADETGGSLFERLSEIGGELILETLKHAEEGALSPEKQPEEGMTYAPMLTKEMGDVDWSLSAETIERRIRGLSPWPGAYSHIGGKLLKIHKAALLSKAEAEMLFARQKQEGRTDAFPEAFAKADARTADAGSEARPGRILTEGGRLFVLCGDGALELLLVQLEGKKRMDSETFLRGREAFLREHNCFEQALRP